LLQRSTKFPLKCRCRWEVNQVGSLSPFPFSFPPVSMVKGMSPRNVDSLSPADTTHPPTFPLFFFLRLFWLNPLALSLFSFINSFLRVIPSLRSPLLIELTVLLHPPSLSLFFPPSSLNGCFLFERFLCNQALSPSINKSAPLSSLLYSKSANFRLSLNDHPTHRLFGPEINPRVLFDRYFFPSLYLLN